MDGIADHVGGALLAFRAARHCFYSTSLYEVTKIGLAIDSTVRCCDCHVTQTLLYHFSRLINCIGDRISRARKGGTPLATTDCVSDKWLHLAPRCFSSSIPEAAGERERASSPSNFKLRHYQKIENVVLLQKLAESMRQYGRFPTSMELRMYRNIDPAFPTDRTISKRFPTKAALVAALAQWVNENEKFVDLAVKLAQENPGSEYNTVDQPNEGLVYLIRSGSHFKIGRSDELERRIKEIRVALPEVATLVHSIRTDDPAGIEAYWHRRFADRRANGEWFKLFPADITAFKRRKFQ